MEEVTDDRQPYRGRDLIPSTWSHENLETRVYDCREQAEGLVDFGTNVLYSLLLEALCVHCAV